MAAPPEYNPEVFRNLTFYKQFRRTDNVTGNPINLTNNTITGQIWNKEETKNMLILLVLLMTQQMENLVFR